jgi:nucleotide-binding universal stress UspA family protein
MPQHDFAVQIVDDTRRHAAAHQLDALAATLGSPKPATILADGDPAEVIVQTATAGGSGAIVMVLHDTTGLGPRMGSVTYRVLCRTQSPVLALPPTAAAADRKPEVFAGAIQRTR